MPSLGNGGLARYAVSIIHPVPKLTLTKLQCDYCKQKKFRYILKQSENKMKTINSFLDALRNFPNAARASLGRGLVTIPEINRLQSHSPTSW
jgi:hypothetical protein